MDNLNLFSDKADNYVKARPSYAPALLDKLEEYGLKKGSAVADIGSGTGIFTRQLLDKGAKVFAVELNDKMRQKAETSLEKFNNFISVMQAPRRPLWRITVSILSPALSPFIGLIRKNSRLM